MIILGIDPGYAITGYGLVVKERGAIRALDYGIISTPAKTYFPLRLRSIHEGLVDLIDTVKPDCIAIEELFFSRNTTTAIGTAQARGVAVLAAAQAGIPVYEYTPLQVKMAVTGYGRAEKIQIQEMVKILLKLKKRPQPDDAADALAVAICHAHSGNRLEALSIGGYQ
ncbi:MAG TPA: crossover junction endodeoxyribonuclease RuvC [Clostridiaceae bacterium]|nr:crossover junction endodeoxyribonuclease RuvC [Clostridiaceae bacterium]